MENNNYVMYLVVKKSLNMSIGKTSAQVGHAVGLIYKKYYKNYKYISPEEEFLESKFSNWENSGYTKIVLGANDKDFEKIKELALKNWVNVLVVDNGHTELEPNTETVIGLFPMLKEESPKYITKLQLLK